MGKTLLSLFILLKCILNVASELKFVLELFRHGARAPWNQLSSTTDKLNQTWAGDSELTLSGMRQHFLLGHELRNKYVINQKFLDSSYNLKQLYVISTDTNRTIMSAYSQLLGLYPPSTGPNLLDNQTENAVPPVKVDNLEQLKSQLGNAALPNNTQVFPIHVFSKADKYFNLQDTDMCRGVIGLREKNSKKELLKTTLDNFNKDYPNLGQQVNMTINTWQQLYFFADGFVSGHYDQRTYPQIQYDQDKLYNRSLEILGIDMFESNFGDSEQMIALNAMSPIFNRIEEYFNKVLSEDSKPVYSNSDPKMVLYSAHDTTIAAMWIFLNKAFSQNLTYSYVPFASNFIIEFSRNDNATKPYAKKDYNIDILYNGKKFQSANYEDFSKNVAKVIIPADKTASFCGYEKESDTYFLVAIGILSLVALGLIISIIVVFVKRRKAKDYLPV